MSMQADQRIYSSSRAGAATRDMHPVGRNLVAAQALLLLLLCSLVDALGSPGRVDSLQCHVCGGSTSPSGPDPPPPCRPGVLPPPRPCPPDYVGCLTSFDGTSLIRTCGDWAHEDCKLANRVVYCYCHGRLCNTREPKDFREWFPSVDQFDDDDEDDDDTAELGSGDFDNDGGFTRSVSAGSSSTTWPTSTRGVTSTTSAGSTTSTSTTTSTTTSRTTTPITSTPGMRAPSTVPSDGDLYIGGSSSSRESTGSTETTNSTDSEVLVGVKKGASAAAGASSSLWVLTLAGMSVAILYRPRNDR